MNTILPRWLFPMLVLSLITVSGCGKKGLSRKETFSVQGRLLLDGQPVRFALVHFIPTDPNNGVEASGSTNEDGVFTLGTYEGPDGAPAGEYKIEIEEYDVVRMGDLPPGAMPTKIPSQFKTPDVTIEVKADVNDLGDIKID